MGFWDWGHLQWAASTQSGIKMKNEARNTTTLFFHFAVCTLNIFLFKNDDILVTCGNVLQFAHTFAKYSMHQWPSNSPVKPTTIYKTRFCTLTRGGFYLNRRRQDDGRMHISSSKLEIFASNRTNANNDVKCIIIPWENAFIKMHITTTQFNYSADLNFQMNESHFVDFRHAVAEVWAWVLH